MLWQFASDFIRVTPRYAMAVCIKSLIRGHTQICYGSLHKRFSPRSHPDMLWHLQDFLRGHTQICYGSLNNFLRGHTQICYGRLRKIFSEVTPRYAMAVCVRLSPRSHPDMLWQFAYNFNPRSHPDMLWAFACDFLRGHTQICYGSLRKIFSEVTPRYALAVCVRLSPRSHPDMLWQFA